MTATFDARVPMVTLSPSPSMTTSSRITSDPSSAAIRSTRIVSSFDTRYCLPPVLTNAYMASIPRSSVPLTGWCRLSAPAPRRGQCRAQAADTRVGGKQKHTALEPCKGLRWNIRLDARVSRPQSRHSIGISGGYGGDLTPVSAAWKGPCRRGSCGASPISRCSLSPCQGCAATTSSFSSTPRPGAVGGGCIRPPSGAAFPAGRRGIRPSWRWIRVSGNSGYRRPANVGRGDNRPAIEMRRNLHIRVSAIAAIFFPSRIPPARPRSGCRIAAAHDPAPVRTRICCTAARRWRPGLSCPPRPSPFPRAYGRAGLLEPERVVGLQALCEAQGAGGRKLPWVLEQHVCRVADGGTDFATEAFAPFQRLGVGHAPVIDGVLARRIKFTAVKPRQRVPRRPSALALASL